LPSKLLALLLRLQLHSCFAAEELGLVLIVGKTDGVGEGDEVAAMVWAGVGVGFGDGFGVCVGRGEVGVIAVGCGVVVAA
jgi:hypothetical protein